MQGRRKVSFLAKKTVEWIVTIKAQGKNVSFIAKAPSKNRERVTFHTKKK